jgi:hypothetical protein
MTQGGKVDSHSLFSENTCPTPQYLAQEGEMGAPGGGLKQCAQGWGQDRTSVGSPVAPTCQRPRSPSSQHDSGSMAGGSKTSK